MTTTRDALSRVVRYLGMRRIRPLRQVDEHIHGIHMGTEWEADLRLGDLETVIAAMLSPPSDAEVEIVARTLADADCAGLRLRGIMTEPKSWRVFEKEARDGLDAFLRTRFQTHYPQNTAGTA